MAVAEVRGYRRCAVQVIDRETDKVIATGYSSFPRLVDLQESDHLQVSIAEASSFSMEDAQKRLEQLLARKGILHWFRRERPGDADFLGRDPVDKRRTA